jgi:hypothetical protein
MMFETGLGNAGLLDVYARSVARPSANSVTYEVYRLCPTTRTSPSIANAD